MFEIFAKEIKIKLHVISFEKRESITEDEI